MNLRERLSTQHLSCIKDGRMHSFQGLSKVIWLSFVFIIALSFRTNGQWKERVGICWLCRPILWSQRLASIASVKSNIALQIFALFSCNWEGSGDIHFGVLWFPDLILELNVMQLWTLTCSRSKCATSSWGSAFLSLVSTTSTLNSPSDHIVLPAPRFVLEGSFRFCQISGLS